MSLRRALLAIGALALVAASASADPPVATPVVVSLHGTAAVRVLVADGTTGPCTSTNDRRLWEGRVDPGGTVTLGTFTGCVCVEQTFAPFADVDWSSAQILCRPQICSYSGRGRICRPAPDPTIRVELTSQRP